MRIQIDRRSKTPMYLQISRQIKEQIFSGSLVDGYPLPSERSLARELSVHRNTVIRAYSDLKAEGLILSYQGQGYRVNYRTLFYGMVKKPVNWESLIKEDYVSFESDFDQLFSKSYEADLISFGGGVAAREPYPAEEIADMFERILKNSRDKAYFYTPYQGDRELREEITSFMRSKGIVTKPGNIQVFSENNQALDFLMSLTLSPGDKIVTQETLSPDVYRTIQLAGGKILTVPVDQEGMTCDHLEALLERERPKFIYVDSSFNNPTGILMSVGRRRKLLELSYKYRIPIIEEDEGSELYYDVPEVPSIKSMDAGSNVIYMYSFSLTMVPGLGVSFVIADREVVKRLSEMISVQIITLDWASQMLTLEYMKEGVFFERLKDFRRICREKRDLMCLYMDGLAKRFSLEYRKPKGGVYLWVKLPAEMDSRELLLTAQREGITFIPGHVFYPKKAMGRNYMRLNYSYPAVEEIRKGMAKLEAALHKEEQKIQIKSDEKS